MAHNPYDELPYKSLPVEWTAPERLSLVSLLHGGPRPPLDSYRLLELGCGDGSNLLPMAWYRRHATFVGVDGAHSRIQIAEARKSALGLSNIDFVHTDFLAASRRVAGQFDFILAHGVVSWVTHEARDALLELCAQRLAPNGLLYLNYNTFPGWSVRGMVREFLLAQTIGAGGLRARAQMAQDVAAKLAASPPADGHPYSALIAREFRFVCESHISYVGHEYLAAENHAYWRSEFRTLTARYGLEHVGDADFNYSSGRISEDVLPYLGEHSLTGRSVDDTVDLLCYRQLHSPILTHGPVTRRAASLEDFSELSVASSLAPCEPRHEANPMFLHHTGFQVEVKDEAMRVALERLQPLWPRGLRVGEVLPDVDRFIDDLKLLHGNGLIELRCIQPDTFHVDGGALNAIECQHGGYMTTPYHTRETAPGEFEAAQISSRRQRESDDGNRIHGRHSPAGAGEV